ncbi:MAG: ACT domain-containing protein [Cytophagaceae bacterium]
METLHQISMHFIHNPGIVIRVALVLERRGYTIMSMNIIPAVGDHHAEMRIAAKGNPAKMEQIIKQLSKLIDVYYVAEIDEKNIIPAEPRLMAMQA